MCKVESDDSYGSIWECYAPDSYRPATTESGKLSRRDFVGWSGIAPITLLIENIIGLEFNAQENSVTFNLPERRCCGIENMIFNSNKISVVCTEYAPYRNKTTIEIEAEKPFKLNVLAKYLGRPQSFDIPVGKTTLKI